jgi:hypothetical protein
MAAMIGGAVIERVPPAAPADVSIARLHGEACWWCGAVQTTLRTVGEVSTPVDGGHRVWPIVACPDHLSRRVTS